MQTIKINFNLTMSDRTYIHKVFHIIKNKIQSKIYGFNK